MVKRVRFSGKYGNIFWLFIPLFIFAVFLQENIGVLPAQGQKEVEKRKIESRRVDISDFVWDKNGLITLWFDDAWLSQYEQGYRIVEKFGYRAALAVPTKHIAYEAYMNWNQIRKLHFKGWEIVPHSRNHDCSLVSKSLEEIKEEILGSKQDLFDQGIMSDIYVPPCGVTSQEANSLVQAHFTAQRAVEEGLNLLPVKERYNLKIVNVGQKTTLDEIRVWIRRAKYYRQWLIFMFHEIDEGEGSLGVTPEMLEGILEEVKSAGLAVVVPSEALSF
jgi:hypothetical protein